MTNWSLDKRVPLTLIGAILVQTFVFGWMASSFNSRVSSLEDRVSAMADQRDRLIVVETLLRTIERKLDDLTLDRER